MIKFYSRKKLKPYFESNTFSVRYDLQTTYARKIWYRNLNCVSYTKLTENMTLQVRLWTFPYTNNTFQLHKTRYIKFDGRIYTWHCAGIEYNAETCSSYTDYIFIEIRQVNLTFMTDVYVPSECCLLPWSKQFFFTFIIRSAIFSFYSAFWKTFLNNEWIKFYLIVILRRLYNA